MSGRVLVVDDGRGITSALILAMAVSGISPLVLGATAPNLARAMRQPDREERALTQADLDAMAKAEERRSRRKAKNLRQK